MARNRIFYGLFLLAAVVFHSFYTGWFSFFLLLFSVLLPVFSLLVSLPAFSPHLQPGCRSAAAGCICWSVTPWAARSRPNG